MIFNNTAAINYSSPQAAAVMTNHLCGVLPSTLHPAQYTQYNNTIIWTQANLGTQAEERPQQTIVDGNISVIISNSVN